jgi:hypothetical protein
LSFPVPITIPPFNQYQAPVVPLRGLWNVKPQEGDRFATFEVDWMVTTTERAVQIAFSANSPVAFSQIVALCVDNRRSGYDVDFVFPDSNFTITVPAHNQSVFPVFTNALMFYVIAQSGVVAGNITVFQVLNSMPPPISINPTSSQTADAVNGVELNAGNTAQVVPDTVSGSINGFIITLTFAGSTTAELQLVDGTGAVLWADTAAGVDGTNQVINISGLNVRFVNGVSLRVLASTTPDISQANISIFYSSP